MAVVLVVLGLSFFWTEYAHAGAWTVPKHRTWSEFYQKWNYGRDYFTESGKKKTLSTDMNARSWEYVMEPKLEHGITDWLTGMASLEYKEGHYKQYGRPASWGTYVRKNNGLTNVKLGGRLRMLKNPFILSTQSKVFIYPGYGINHGDDPADQNKPDIGYGDDAFEQRILIGKTFNVPLMPTYVLPCYIGAETGYRWRTRHVCNDIPYFVEGGFWPVKWFLLKSEIDGYKCHPGTGSIKESYGIWRIGGVWEVFGGDSVLRQGNKMFNIEFQYGMVLWGKNTTAYQEWIMKVDTQF